MTTQIVEQIVERIGAAQVLDADAVAERATSYWNHAPMQAKAMVLPRNTDEVSTVLRTCSDAGQSVITHGGLTNCVAAAESTKDDIVLSLGKMNRVIEIDPIGGIAVVEAGAVLQKVQEAIADAGMRFPLDLGARGSCTIGGNVATNAGGINVLRYGMMRHLVLGLEAVLADGTVVSSMNRMLKNNAGYDIKQLFIGTEGTLGIVTQAVLRLFPQPSSKHTALVALPDFDSVAQCLLLLRQQLSDSLSAFEIMWGDYYQAVTVDGGHRAPLARDFPFYVVFESEGSDREADERRFDDVLEQALSDGLIADAVVPKSESEIAEIWEIRENFEKLYEVEPVYLYDVSLPIRDMPAYVEQVKANVKARWPNGQCYTIGHVADGNLHPFVSPHQEGDHHEASDECVYEPLHNIGGSVSAEHGIGTDKICWLPHSRTSTEIDLMRKLKKSFDPKNVLNPGRVVIDQ